MSSERERLLRLLAHRSFRTGSFELSSGRQSSYYIDSRTTTMHAEGQALMGPVLLDALEERGVRPELVGGLTMGADPLAYAVARESWRRGSPIHAFSVRKQAKDHGRARRIEGCFEAEAEVVVVEDVVTTGGSALEAAAEVEREGGQVLGVLTLVDREEGGGEAIRGAGHPLWSVFTAGELAAAAGEEVEQDSGAGSRGSGPRADS